MHQTCGLVEEAHENGLLGSSVVQWLAFGYGNEACRKLAKCAAQPN